MVDDANGVEDGVIRSVELPACAEEVWEAVADPDLRAAWLDDPDAQGRTLRIDRADPGERLVWTWWRTDGDDPAPSTVEITLSPLVGGGTRLVVVETPLAPSPAVATASARAAAVMARTRWGTRLLGLELLFVAVGAGVR